MTTSSLSSVSVSIIDALFVIVVVVVIFGVVDKEMMAHALSKGTKVLSGLSFARDMDSWGRPKKPFTASEQPREPRQAPFQ